MPCNPNCPLLEYCLTQKGDHETCADMLLRYNAGLLLPSALMRREKDDVT